jgi:hypothetical protein
VVQSHNATKPYDQAGFAGPRCDVDVDECSSAPCHDGACTDRAAGYDCDCQGTGYQGENCADGAGECDASPCANGGGCFDVAGAFVCACAAGFGGETCGDALTVCPEASNNCDPTFATCSISSAGYPTGLLSSC